jgi:SAM-dependent methyltransferase
MFKKQREINHTHIAEIVRHDYYISSIYKEIYTSFSLIIGKNEIKNPKVLELGGGDCSFASLFWNDLIVTDADESLDKVNVRSGINAEDLPFKDKQFNFVIAKDTLHHFKEPYKALAEINRVLIPGGSFIVSEPFWSPLGRFIYKYFHPEPWDTSVETVSRLSNDLWDSNQALLLMLTGKFSNIFSKKFPNYELKIYYPTYGISYLLSGGVHKRNKISSRFLWKVHNLEKKSKAIMSTTGLNVIAEFKKIF